MREFLRRYFYLIKTDRKQLPLLCLFFILSSLVDFLGIGLVGPFISLANDPKHLLENPKYQSLFQALHIDPSHVDNHWITQLGLVIAGFFILKSIASYAANKKIMTFAYTCKANLIARLSSNYLSLSYLQLCQISTANLIQKIIDHTNVYKEMMLVSSLQLVAESIIVLCIFSLLMLVNPQITGTLAGAFLLNFIVYDYYSKRRFKRTGEETITSSEKIILWLKQGLAGFKEIKILHIESLFIQKISRFAKDYSSATIEAKALQNLPKQILECLLVSVVIGAILYNLNQYGSITNIFPLLAMLAISAFRVLPSIYKINLSIAQMRQAKPAMYELYDDLKQLETQCQTNHQAETTTSSSPLSSSKQLPAFQSLHFSNVYFRYPNNAHPTLKQLNLTIKRGQLIAVLGESGAGKSTLIDLITSLLQAERGSIRINNQYPIEAYQAAWQALIAYIPQNYFLLDDSIANNITLEEQQSLDPLKEQRLWQALATAQLENFVRSLPQQLQTNIGENGCLLSGGQKQRLALARAFYCNRDIIILDEPTSSLDRTSSRGLYEVLASIKGNKTIIVITHQYENLKYFDEIYHLKQGELQQTTEPHIASEHSERLEQPAAC